MWGELPDGCDYTRVQRWRDEWRLSGRIWRGHRSEPAYEREVISQHSSRVAVHTLRSKAEVDHFLASIPTPGP
jgi:hypothetical protein